MKKITLFLLSVLVCFSLGAVKVEHLYKSYLTSNVITSVDESPDGTLIVAAYASGINLMKHGKWTFQDVGDNVYMRVVKASDDGSYWVGGGNSGGLQHYQNGNFTQVLQSIDINDIYIVSPTQLWLTTKGDGVIYYNDGDTTTYTMSNAGLPDNWGTGMATDSKGNLWVATFHGLTMYDGSNWTSWTTSNSAMPAVRIEDVAVDKDDNIWLAARDSGVVMYDGTNFYQHYKPEGMMESLCMTLSCADDGAVWAAVKNKHKYFNIGFSGIVRYKDGAWEQVFPGGETSRVRYVSTADNIACIEAIGDKVYIGHNSKGGLLVYSNDEWTGYLSPKNPRDLAFDDEGKLWMVADEAGVFHYTDNQWMEYNSYNAPLPHEGLQDIHVLNDSIFTVGVWNESLIAFKDSTWQVGVEGDVNSYYKIVQGQDDTLWLGSSSNGLLSYANGKVTLADTSLIGLRILQLAYNPNDNSLWFSGFDTLYHWRNKVLDKYSFKDVGFTTITAMEVDADNHLWMGTYNGLVKYDGTDWTFFTTVNSAISYDMIDVLSQDSKGHIWIGLRNADIVSFDRVSQWAIYDYAAYDLPSDHMVCMAVNEYDKVYAGYWRAGVVILDPNVSGLEDAIATEENLLCLMPNPAKSSFKIVVEPGSSCTVNIYATSGVLVRSISDVSANKSIDISSLDDGLYIVKIRDDKGRFYQEKLIKLGE